MRDRSLMCDTHTLHRLLSLDPYSKSFPVYKQSVTKCKIIPEHVCPSTHNNVKSYQMAVQSQQLCILDKKKITCGQCNSGGSSCQYQPFHPSHGFQLIEYEDKCCCQNGETESSKKEPVPSQTFESESIKSEEVVNKESSEKTFESKLVGPDCLTCSHRSVHCNLIACKNPWCLPSPCPKPSCLKTKQSSELDKSSVEKKASCDEIFLCKKCQEKRTKKAKTEKCHCKKSSAGYTPKNCPCVKDKNKQPPPNESLDKVECNKYKCKYLDLIQKIKCIFTKER